MASLRDLPAHIRAAFLAKHGKTLAPSKKKEPDSIHAALQQVPAEQRAAFLAKHGGGGSSSRGPVQTGKKGGRFILLKSGRKFYIGSSGTAK